MADKLSSFFEDLKDCCKDDKSFLIIDRTKCLKPLYIWMEYEEKKKEDERESVSFTLAHSGLRFITMNPIYHSCLLNPGGGVLCKIIISALLSMHNNFRLGFISRLRFCLCGLV